MEEAVGDVEVVRSICSSRNGQTTHESYVIY
jgi:hypothetical protein